MANDEAKASSSEDEVPVESLIQGRAKRSTAGLNMSALLNAEADDDLALLFEEIDDDNEFAVAAGEEGADDGEMGLDSSSDDDDDQGPNAAADDLEGERQIEKEEKAEKKKRRAKEDLRYKIVSKKVKIDPTAVSAVSAVSAVQAPRPKKKSERVSWIPTPEDGPTRSSSRRQTMQNKERTHARLKDSEEKRIRLIATMEEAAKRKAKFKPKEMTQAERLAEADRVEKHNSKSLNRWEEMEKKKAEERRAKIEALQNRRLEGPVMSYWSGVATWTDGRLTRVGKVDITPKPEKEDNTRKKAKKTDKEGKTSTEKKPEDTAAEPATSQTAPSTSLSNMPKSQTTSIAEGLRPDQPPPPPDPAEDPTQKNFPKPENRPSIDVEITATSSAPADIPTATTPAQPSTPVPGDVPMTDAPAIPTSQNPETEKEAQGEAPPGGEIGQEPKCGDYSTANERMTQEKIPKTSPPEVPSQVSPEAPASGDKQLPNHDSLPKVEGKSGDTLQEPSPPTLPDTQSPHKPENTVSLSSQVAPAAPVQPNPERDAQPPPQPEQEILGLHIDNTGVPDEDSLPPPPPPVIEHTGRFLTVLENFDEKTAQSREFSIYFNAKKPPRLTKISSSLCVITSLPSRYRDPDTSLPFANSYAYNEIRHTTSQKYSWSPMLGCYVGLAGVAARGVPDRFLGASKKDEKGEGVMDKSNGNCGDGEVAVSGNDKGSESKTTTNNPGAPTPISAAPASPTTSMGDPMGVDK